VALAAAERHRAEVGMERLRRRGHAERLLLARNSRGLRTARTVLAVVEEAREHRLRSPREALEWAEVATTLAELVTGPCASDARAEAWAEAANARRMLGAWDLAEEAFCRADRALLDGSGDPIVAAEVASLRASLANQRERPIEAAGYLTRTLPLVVEAGDPEIGARLLVQLAQCCYLALDPETGLEVLERAWQLCPDDCASSLRVAIVHNTILLVLDSGDPRLALELYELARPTYRMHGREVERARGRWIAGRALAELGAPDDAAALYAAARATLEQQGRVPEVAYLVLDQALLELDRSPAEAARLAKEALPLLHGLGRPQGTLGALQVAIQAGERQGLRLAILRAHQPRRDGRIARP
jgi:tetratricopeptide (TPR) repeat protein